MKEINYLKENGKISLVAPSFGCTTEPYQTRLKIAIDNLKQDGFTISEGVNIFASKHKIRSNTARKCAEEFMEAYRSDSNAIISVGGGEIMCEILPFINFKELEKLPHKFFMGFSDNTNLTYTLATLSHIPTIYGPCAGSFGFKPYKYSVKDGLDLLMGKVKDTYGYPVWERYKNKSDDPLKEGNYTEKKVLRVYPNSEVEIKGRLLGGCLDCLITLCGTKFDKTKEYIEEYKEDGFIWFLEACDLSPVGIQRALFQLRQAGWFKYCKGFIMGRPLCFRKKMFGITHYRAIKEALKGIDVPLILDADLGHFDPSMPIITGVVASVEVKNENIHIHYEG